MKVHVNSLLINEIFIHIFCVYYIAEEKARHLYEQGITWNCGHT